jgi:predicted ATPase/DNA-binding SARP family transcriptional activator
MQERKRQFRVRLFGIPQIWEETNSGLMPISFGTKQRTLPFYLLLIERSRLSRLELKEQAEDDPVKGTESATFNKRLARLRDSMTANGLSLLEELSHNEMSHWLDYSQFQVDLWDFKDHCTRGKQEQSPDLLQQALELYSGSVLHGYEIPHVKQIRSAYFSQAWDIVENLEMLGTLAPLQKTTYLEQWHHASPKDEIIGRKLMRVFELAGQPERAEEVYYALRQSLAPERLEGVTEQIFQEIKDIKAKRLQPSPAPQPTRVSCFNNIPAEYPQPLIDRSKEKTLLLKRLQGRRLVTVVGTGGVGKTRIIEEVAREQMPKMRGGAVFVSLTCLSAGATRREIEEEINRVLGSKSLEEGLKDRHLLLVLDNAEHVRESLSVLLREILIAHSKVHVLISSREPIGLEEEQVHFLKPLTLPLHPAFATIENLIKSEAVQLLLARIPDPHFTLTSENAALIAQICHYSAGVPLCIELIATHIQEGYSLAGLLKKLQKGIGVLHLPTESEIEGESDDTYQDRHASMEAALDWGYRTLTEKTQGTLLSLCVFATAFTEEATAALWDTTDARAESRLTRLKSKSFLQINAEGAYQFHEAIRQYLLSHWEALPEEVRHTHEERFVAYYTDFAVLHKKEAIILLSERNNLFHALRLGIEQNNDTAVASLAETLCPLCMNQGGLSRLYNVLLPAEPFLISSSAFSTLKGLGNVAYRLEEYPIAHRCFSLCLVNAQNQHDTLEEAKMLGSMGNVSQGKKDLSDARAYFKKSNALFKERGDCLGTMRGWSNLANLEQRDDKFTESIAYHRLAIDHARKIEDKSHLCLCLNNLANTLFRAKQEEAIADVLQEALQKYQENNLPGLIVHTLTLLVSFLKNRGQITEAIFYVGVVESLRNFHNLPLPCEAILLWEQEMAFLQEQADEKVFWEGYGRGKEQARNNKTLLRGAIQCIQPDFQPSYLMINDTQQRAALIAER